MGGLCVAAGRRRCRSSSSSSVLSHSEQDSDTLQLALTRPPRPMTGHSAPHTVAAAAGS